MTSDNIKDIAIGLMTARSHSIYGEDKGPLIERNQIAGGASVLYEKLRYMVDYKEVHTIRRSAIERILKRYIFIENAENVGMSLLEDMITSGYLVEEKVPVSLAVDINLIIEKYIKLGKEARVRDTYILRFMASEIEKFLFPDTLNDLVVESFYNLAKKIIKYEGKIPKDTLDAQIYLGVRRSFLEDDYDMSLYALVVHNMPALVGPHKDAESLAPRFREVLSNVLIDIEDPLGWKISSKLKNHAVCMRVIREVFKEYGAMADSIFADTQKLEQKIQEILEHKYYEQYESARESGMRAIIYILLTKIILAFLIELPYEKFVMGEVNHLSLATNVIFHPLVLFFMVTSIPYGSHQNTLSIITGVNQIISDKPLKDIYINTKTKNTFLENIFNTMYMSLFVLSFGLIFYVLNRLGFSIVSISLFILFLTLVSYMGFRIRYNASKWKFNVPNMSIRNLLWNFLTVPIIQTGRWFSRKFSSVNIFVLIMDFIIETPFKLLLSTMNSFVGFLRDKREDPY